MPLIQGKSKKSFSKNVETEMKAGKPQDQSLAIAYSVKKKNQKKMAHGGLLSAETEQKPTADQGEAHACTPECQDMTVRQHELIKAGSEKATADRFEQDESPKAHPGNSDHLKRGGHDEPTADTDEETQAPFAFGGDVEDVDKTNHMGTLAEAIAKRLSKHMMAKGGEVHDDGLNENSEEHGNFEDDLSYDALGKENFDDDQLSGQPKNSNEIGDEEEKDDENKKDNSLISKIRARNKKS